MPRFKWNEKSNFKKTPLIIIILLVTLIVANVYLNIDIKKKKNEIAKDEKISLGGARNVPTEFSKKSMIGNDKCPGIIAGNSDAPLKFKLFESETCPYCVAQNKVMDELLPEFGDLFYAEWYDVLSCKKEAENYKVVGVPTFIFNAQGVEKPAAYGFLDKQQLQNYICQVSQKC